MIRAIIFDCFGVLTADAWHAFRLSLPKEQQHLAQDAMHLYSSGFMDKPEFLTQVAEITGKTPAFITDLLHNDTSKNEALLDYIKKLKQHGYKIGLLSNIASNWVRDSFLTQEEQAMFDTMVFSYEVGMTKPDPNMYLMACERLGVEPNEAVMVDDIASFCQAAQHEGLCAIVYNDIEQFQSELTPLLAITD